MSAVATVADAAVRSTTVIKPDLPLVGTATRVPAGVAPEHEVLLIRDELTFETVRTALVEKHVVGVVVGSRRYGDHARKMLQEAGKALVVCDEPVERIRDGGRYQVDDTGLVDVEALAVPVTAISSYLTDRIVATYRAWNVRDIGYFRHKFCLFRLLAEDPTAYHTPDRIEDYLTGTLCELLTHGWRRVRLVLSDPTSAELRHLGVPVPEEENPELGVRGPRAAQHWWPELRAIRAALACAGATRLQLSVPFVSDVAEFAQVAEMVREAGLADDIELGLTLEVPSMVYALPRLIAEQRPAFVAVGTSDLFALVNGIDRSHRDLKIDPFSPVNRRIVDEICDVAAAHEVPFFVCGEIRKDPATARALANRGTAELLAAASIGEIARMTRAAASHAG
jgi:hypothetical protein